MWKSSVITNFLTKSKAVFISMSMTGLTLSNTAQCHIAVYVFGSLILPTHTKKFLSYMCVCVCVVKKKMTNNLVCTKLKCAVYRNIVWVFTRQSALAWRRFVFGRLISSFWHLWWLPLGCHWITISKMHRKSFENWPCSTARGVDTFWSSSFRVLLWEVTGICSESLQYFWPLSGIIWLHRWQLNNTKPQREPGLELHMLQIRSHCSAAQQSPAKLEFLHFKNLNKLAEESENISNMKTICCLFFSFSTHQFIWCTLKCHLCGPHSDLRL